MPDCQFLAKCPFFHDQMPLHIAMADHYKKAYCKQDSSRCARFRVRVALGPGTVPADLCPNETKRAGEIIQARGVPAQARHT